MSDFGVYLTCFKEQKAVECAIESLRQHNPDCPVFLVSDGGLDYSYLENKHKNLKALLEYDSRGFVPKINPNTFRKEENQKEIRKSIMAFMDRISRAIDFCQKDYILIMEPDNLIRGKLNIPENAVITGTRLNKGQGPSLGWQAVLKDIEGAVDVDCWGAVACFLKADIFKKVYKRIEDDHDLFIKFCMSDPRLPNYDVFLPVFFGILGYSEVFNPEVTSTNWNPVWKSSRHKLVDQYYENHPLANSPNAGASGRSSE